MICRFRPLPRKLQYEGYVRREETYASRKGREQAAGLRLPLPHALQRTSPDEDQLTTLPAFEIGLEPVTVRDLGQAPTGSGTPTLHHLRPGDRRPPAEKSRPDWKYVHDAEDMTFHEIFVLFGYLTRGRRGKSSSSPGCSSTPMRGTALVAQAGGGGRPRPLRRRHSGSASVSSRASQEEFEATRRSSPVRTNSVDEQIDVLYSCGLAELITYEGGSRRIEDGGINPLPVQR